MSCDGGPGAWTHARLWMKAKDLVLHTGYEWDARPPFLDEVTETARATWVSNELNRFPRTPEHTPVWLTEADSAS